MDKYIVYTVPVRLFPLLTECLKESREKYEHAELVHELQSMVLHEDSPKRVTLQDDCNKWYFIMECLGDIKKGVLSQEDKAWLENNAEKYPKNFQSIIFQICETTFGVKKSLLPKLQGCLDFMAQKISETELAIYHIEFPKPDFKGDVSGQRVSLEKEKRTLDVYHAMRDCLLMAQKGELPSRHYAWLYTTREIFNDTFYAMKYIVNSLESDALLKVKRKKPIQHTLRYSLQRGCYGARSFRHKLGLQNVHCGEKVIDNDISSRRRAK